MAIHQSHDTEVIGNVCVDTPGGCVVTEDGNETRNVIRGNFAAFAVGNGGDSVQNVDSGCPGCESAYWFRGVANVIEGNESWNSQIGFNLFNQRHQGKTESCAGGEGRAANLRAESRYGGAYQHEGNVTAANSKHGHEGVVHDAVSESARWCSRITASVRRGTPFQKRASHMYLVDAIVTCADGICAWRRVWSGLHARARDVAR